MPDSRQPYLSPLYASLLPYPILAFINHDANLPGHWLTLLAITYGLGCWYWLYRRYRFIADTPTANSKSAAQGYTECFGRAEALDGPPIITPHGGMRCLWFRSEIRHQRSQGGLGLPQRQQSDASFRLQDTRGDIIIEPEGASIETRHQRSWSEDDSQISESWICAGDPLYVLGELRSEGGLPDRQAFQTDLHLLLDEWKRDPPGLLQRFDRNRDGQIDAEEWEQARQAAHIEVGRNHRDIAAIPPAHHIAKPRDRRPYLISWRDPQSVATLHRRLAWLHATCASGTLLWLTRHL